MDGRFESLCSFVPTCKIFTFFLIYVLAYVHTFYEEFLRQNGFNFVVIMCTLIYIAYSYCRQKVLRQSPPTAVLHERVGAALLTCTVQYSALLNSTEGGMASRPPGSVVKNMTHTVYL